MSGETLTIVLTVLGTIITVSSIFIGIIGRMKTTQESNEQQNKVALWSEVNKLRQEFEGFKAHINKDYWDKQEIREFVKLSSEPLLVKLNHIEEQLENLTRILKPEQA